MNPIKKMSLFILTLVLSFNLILADDNDDLLKTLNPGPKPKYTIEVTKGGKILGKIVIETFPQVAPKHCRNFDSLVAIKFYDGTKFHRVMNKFMIQGGDPNSKKEPKSLWGYGDETQTKIPAEFSGLKHLEGVLSAARGEDINSATSQFFICHVDKPSLDGKYTIFGRVVENFDVVDDIADLDSDDKEGDNRPKIDITMTITKNK